MFRFGRPIRFPMFSRPHPPGLIDLYHFLRGEVKFVRDEIGSPFSVEHHFLFLCSGLGRRLLLPLRFPSLGRAC